MFILNLRYFIFIALQANTCLFSKLLLLCLIWVKSEDQIQTKQKQVTLKELSNTIRIKLKKNNISNKSILYRKYEIEKLQMITKNISDIGNSVFVNFVRKYLFFLPPMCLELITESYVVKM